MNEGVLTDEPTPADAGGEQQVINEVKAAYPLLLNIMGDEVVIDGLVQDARGGDPAQVLAAAVAAIVDKIKAEMPDLSPGVMGAIGMIAIEEFADLFNQIGVEVTPEMKEAAASSAVQMYMQMAGEEVEAQVRNAVAPFAEEQPGGVL